MGDLKENIAKKIVSSITHFSPKLASRIIYKIHTGKNLHLKNPKLFNEKLMYLKLNDYKNNDLVTMCSDKLQLEKYTTANGYKNLTNKIIKIYDSASDIDFDTLPKKFALKCNHGCKFNVIVDNKETVNEEEIRKLLDKWVKTKHGYVTAEPHYFKISPKIYAEEYIEGENGEFPDDYKVYVFNGKAKCVLVCTNRKNGLEQKMYDLKWKELDYLKDEVVTKKKIAKPKKFDEMIKISEKLAKPFRFVRVDFYEVKDKLILGELTFTPARCCDNDYNERGNIELGKMLDLNEK